MNWDAVSAIAEIVGVVGVIVSLIYVAKQLKENTNVSRSQSRQSISECIHIQLGLMPGSHWRPFVKFFKGYSTSFGFGDAWQANEEPFAEEFRDWVRKEIAHPESDGDIVG